MLQDFFDRVSILHQLERELADLYGETFEIFAGRHHARLIPDDVPQHDHPPHVAITLCRSDCNA